MLKVVILVVLVLALIFVLACIGLACLVIYIIIKTPKGDIAPTVRYGPSDISPPHDETLFNRLANEAMAYATRPYVTTIVDVNGVFLLHTVSDVFGKRVYAESRRRVGKALNTVICVYAEGNHSPTAMAAMKFPATQVDWPAHFNALSDVTANGSKMSFTDHLGHRREIRIPKKRRHHA